MKKIEKIKTKKCFFPLGRAGLSAQAVPLPESFRDSSEVVELVLFQLIGKIILIKLKSYSYSVRFPPLGEIKRGP